MTLIKLTKPEFDLGDSSSTVDGSLRWWRLLPEQGNYQKIDQMKKKEILGENEKQLHKVDRCLARYSPRA